MIINLLTQKKWNLGGSGFNNLPASAEASTAKFFTGNLSQFQVTANTSHVEYIFYAFERNKLSYIEFDYTGTAEQVAISYSLDGNQWTEFPFKVQKLNGKESFTSDPLYRWYSSDVSGSQVFIDTTAGSACPGNELDYIFRRTNSLTKEIVNICEGIDFVHLKVEFYNVSVSSSPLYINALRVFIDEEFNDRIIDSEILALRAQDFFNSRAYDDQPFMKDLTQSYMQMLSSNIMNPSAPASAQVRNPNDFYIQSLGIDTTMFFDDLAENNNDFSFNSVKFNPISLKYETFVEIFNPNNAIFQDLNVRQFALDWKNLVDHLESNSASASTEWTQYKKAFILFLLKHINLLNHMKGTRYLIEYVLNLYAKFFGYNVLSVVEDGRFIYRISASIPTVDWNSLLKTIVHPCGWNVIYNEIDSSTELQIEPGPINNMNKRYLKALGAIDCVNYFEGDIYNRPRVIKKLSFLRTSNLPDQVRTITVNGVTGIPTNGDLPYKFRSKYDEAKLRVNLGWEEKATAHVNYGSSATILTQPIDREIVNNKNYNFTSDSLENTFVAKFNTTGIVTKYRWRIFLQNTLVKTIFTPFGDLFTNLNDLGPVGNYRMDLTISHQDWIKTIFEYRKNYISYRTMPLLFAEKNHRRKLMSVFAGENRGVFSSGMSFNSFLTEGLQTAGAVVNEVGYSMLSPSSSAAFISEFASAGIITNSPVTSGLKITCTLKYKKPGVFSKYTWLVYVGGVLERSIETNFNSAIIAVNNVPATSIYLTLEKDDFSYTIPTPVIVRA